MAVLTERELMYIAGAGHSGSSLFDIVLGTLPGVVSTGEVHRLSIAPASRTCSCGNTIALCPFWTRLHGFLMNNADFPSRDWADFPLTAGTQATRASTASRITSQLVLAVGWQRLLLSTEPWLRSLRYQQTAARNSWILFDAIARMLDARIVVDSTKSPGRMKSLFTTRPWVMKVVHLVRDGRAVAASTMRRTGCSMEPAAAAWVKANRDVERMAFSMPENAVRRVHYEDFCAAPTRTVAGLLPSEMRSDCDKLRIPAVHERHSLPGNPVLVQDIREIRRDDRWKQQLTAKDLRAFESVAGSYARRLGY